MDYSILQQCMHCGMCLPTCPTYDHTKLERNSPRGRISLMRAVADGAFEMNRSFAEEMSFCLGCLACETACPAGVQYADLFETARADIEKAGLLSHPERTFWRWITLRTLFTHPRLLRWTGMGLRLWQQSGLQDLFRSAGLVRFLPATLRDLEPLAPDIRNAFSDALIPPVLPPATQPRKFRVALLTGCMQDLILSEVNRDTAEVLAENGCEVVTPALQPCCGSIHAHNGETDLAMRQARRLIDLFNPADFDAIISNAGGCGSHLKKFSHLLAGDPRYAERARAWDSKVKDIHEWLVEIDFRKPNAAGTPTPCRATYHDSCHLCHGQKITSQPRAVLRAIPGLELVELPEANWCCGSAGVYNITQPEMASRLKDRKCAHIEKIDCDLVATANPGCHLQLEAGLNSPQSPFVIHPVSLLAAAYRNEVS